MRVNIYELIIRSAAPSYWPRLHAEQRLKSLLKKSSMYVLGLTSYNLVLFFYTPWFKIEFSSFSMLFSKLANWYNFDISKLQLFLMTKQALILMPCQLWNGTEQCFVHTVFCKAQFWAHQSSVCYFIYLFLYWWKIWANHYVWRRIWDN